MRRCEVSVCVVVALLVGVSVCYDEYDISNQIHTQSNVHLTAILDKLTALDERMGSLDQRMTAIDQRMSASDQLRAASAHRMSASDQLQAASAQRMSALDQRVNSIDERVHDLGAGQGRQVVPSLGPQTPATTTTNMPMTDIPFRITRVTKHESDDSYEVKIEYQASSKPAVYLTTRYVEENTLLEEQDMGVVELTVPKPSEPEGKQKEYYGEDDVGVMFLVSDIYYFAILRLYNTSDYMEVPSIELIVPQGHELKYEPGSELELNFAWTVGGDMEAIERERGYYTITVKSDVQDNVVNTTSQGISDHHDGKSIWVEEVSLKGEKGKWRGSGLINSTLIDPEGVLDAFPGVRFNCAVNCLLKEFTMQYRVSFYRSDHSGPFPENFMGFVNDGSEVSSTVSYCEIGDAADGNVTCSINCLVVGALPSHTRISKVLSDGRVETVTNKLMKSFGNHSYAELQVHNVGYADRDVYRCTATSDVSEISKDITITPIKRPEINQNASSVVKHENGTVTGVCVASGNPAPNISLTEGSYNSLSSLSPDLYGVTVTHPDQWTTRAELVITDVDFTDSMYSLECYASNVPKAPEEYSYRFSDRHYMSMY